MHAVASSAVVLFLQAACIARGTTDLDDANGHMALATNHGFMASRMTVNGRICGAVLHQQKDRPREIF